MGLRVKLMVLVWGNKSVGLGDLFDGSAGLSQWFCQINSVGLMEKVSGFGD